MLRNTITTKKKIGSLTIDRFVKEREKRFFLDYFFFQVVSRVASYYFIERTDDRIVQFVQFAGTRNV